MATKEDIGIEPVTEADIEAAEEALSQGRLALEQAKEAFYEGAGEWSAVKDQEAVIEFAEAQLIKLGRDKSKYEEDVRQYQLKTLVRDVSDFRPGNDLVVLGNEFESALEAFVRAFVLANQQIAGFEQRAKALGVPAWSASKLASAKDAYIEWGSGDGTFRVGNREFKPVVPGYLVDRIIGGVYRRLHESDASVHVGYFTAGELTSGSVEPLEDTHELLKAVADAHPADGAAKYYYRGCEWRVVNPNASRREYVAVVQDSGGLFAFAEALSHEEQVQRGLIAITEEEARGDV